MHEGRGTVPYRNNNGRPTKQRNTTGIILSNDTTIQTFLLFYSIAIEYILTLSIPLLTPIVIYNKTLTGATMHLFQTPQTTSGYTSIPEASADEETVAVGHRSSWKTKKLMCAGIIGMTAAVASSALVFYSIMDYSNQDSTASSFLLHASVGADDNKCVPASGPWPAGSGSQDDDGEEAFGASDGPYVTCFASTTGGHCWSHSYIDSWGNWQPCTPQGYGAGWESGSLKTDDYSSGSMGVSGHTFVSLSAIQTCGTGCTEFSSEVPH